MTDSPLWYILNNIYSEYSEKEVNFLGLNIKLTDGELKTDLLVKPTNTRQFFDPASSHTYHIKKEIPYSQALGFIKICSDNENFDKCCNNLEKWLMERGCNDKMIHKQILRAQEYSRNHLLERDVWPKLKFHLCLTKTKISPIIQLF